ncbi:FecR domain-containing protein [Dyadobacter sp. CY261]|uniref:FecR family protein n=1 Tax=Dyadobacter sp. CY261 TaxID=2907203 RepID=UPI001F33A9B1|nr:FecR family protein [Dyadobacter sp. CY261]MCF0074697.1 FecR domain-containing protein [Dyadobacter sp. CY261]
MNREEFAALLEKYQEGRCSDDEKRLVEHWFALLENDRAENISDADLQGIDARIWAGMQEKASLPDLDEVRKNPFRSIYFRWSAIAASLLLIVWFLSGKVLDRGIPLATYSWDERRNDGTGILPVLLEDSSTVELSPGASVRFPTHFEQEKRVVMLKGNAFFSIRKNPKRPFYVHSGDVTTKVLGTSFHVGTAANGRQTTVEVVTGLVSVYAGQAGKKTADILISPNHTATFDRASGKLSAGLAGKPRILNTNVSFRFHNVPLSEVAQHIRDAWGVDIETENKQVLNCTLTADLSGQPLFVQLDIICAASGAKYQIRGSTIRISGPGCKLQGSQAFRIHKLNRSLMQT